MGSFFKVDADQRTDSVKKEQKFGKYSLKLSLFGDFGGKDYLPRLRRLPSCDRWQPLFLVLTMNGIEEGAYSHPESFFLSETHKDFWSDYLKIEGWCNGGCKHIGKMVFIYKDGTKSEHINDYNRPWDNITYTTTSVTFGKKNPVVEIQIYSSTYRKRKKS